MAAAETKKTSLYLDNELRERVGALSSDTGQPASEIYRRAIRSYVDSQPAGRNEKRDIALIKRAVAGAQADVYELFAQLVCVIRDPVTGKAVELIAVRHQRTGKLGLVSARLPGERAEYPIERVMSRSDREELVTALEAADSARKAA